jgi:DNA-binding transcriptional ArsR family regulator
MNGPMTDEMVEMVVQRLSALADGSRVRMLSALRQGAKTVGELAEVLGMGQASVSKHVAVLKAAGLVGTEKQGNKTMCRVCDESVWEICRVVCDGVVRHVKAKSAAVMPIKGLAAKGTFGKKRA